MNGCLRGETALERRLPKSQSRLRKSKLLREDGAEADDGDDAAEAAGGGDVGGPGVAVIGRRVAGHALAGACVEAGLAAGEELAGEQSDVLVEVEAGEEALGGPGVPAGAFGVHFLEEETAVDDVVGFAEHFVGL